MAQKQYSQGPSGSLTLKILPSERLSGLYEIEIPANSELDSLLVLFPYDSDSDPIVRPTRFEWLTGNVLGKKVVLLSVLAHWPGNMSVEVETRNLPIKIDDDIRRIKLDFDFKSTLNHVPVSTFESIKPLDIKEITLIMPSIGITKIFSESPEPIRIAGSKRTYLFDDIMNNSKLISLDYVIDNEQSDIILRTLFGGVIALFFGFLSVFPGAKIMHRLWLLSCIILSIILIATIACGVGFFLNQLPINQYLPFFVSFIIYDIFWIVMMFPPRNLRELLLSDN
ncbi:hypothetical protein ACFLXF_00665 [Chloroflexota bacterium]